MNYEGDLFETEDPDFASFLKNEGKKINRTRKEGNIIFFEFNGKQDIKKLFQRYYCSKTVIAADFFENRTRRLKII